MLCADGNPSDVARKLRTRFAHVLVDEVQDISPIQDAILRLASREDAGDGPGNLFSVGDIKQSIYRFRLAEPTMQRQLERIDFHAPRFFLYDEKKRQYSIGFDSKRDALEFFRVEFTSEQNEVTVVEIVSGIS